VDPDAPEIQTMIEALEAGNSLPFGERDRQYTWISLLPTALDPSRTALRSDNQQLWGKVVDKFVILDTQFKNDIFWRVRELCGAPQTGHSSIRVPLKDRGTNERVHTSRWHRDYPLFETDRYEIFIETHSPEGHGKQIPGDATIAMTSSDDEEGLIKLSAQPLAIVPNETSSQRFTIDSNNVLDTRYSGIRLETQVPAHSSAYPPGSQCNLTFEISKKRSRLLAYVLFVLTGTALGGYAVGAQIDPIAKGLCAALALIFIGYGGLFLNRQLKIVK
jgi:hypothetical protein